MEQENEIGKIITVRVFQFHCEEIDGKMRKFAIGRLSYTKPAGYGVAVARTLTIGATYKARIGQIEQDPKRAAEIAGRVVVLQKV